jgi:hypothetical protein
MAFSSDDEKTTGTAEIGNKVFNPPSPLSTHPLLPTGRVTTIEIRLL